MGGRTTVEAPTREILRMASLIRQLYATGMTQAELARLTGVKQNHLTALADPVRYNRKSIGAEIVRIMRDRMGIDSDYFFDDYEGEAKVTDYSLSKRRRDREFDEMRKTISDIQVQMRELVLAVKKQDAAHASEMLSNTKDKQALEEKLSAARKPHRVTRP